MKSNVKNVPHKSGYTMKRGLSLVLSCLMISALFVPSVFAATTSKTSFSDISKHWAKTYIEQAVKTGFVNGYEDGTFKPDNEITRAEFVTMMNKAIGNDGESDSYFSDVKPFDWFVNDVSKAVAAGYVAGYSDGTFMPSNNITRQEAAVMIARIIPAHGSEKTLKVFADYEKIASWSYNALEKVYGKGYLGGYNDGLLHPTDNLTRAQAAKIIDDILDKETIYRDNLEIQKAGASLKNSIFANSMSVGTTVAEGSVSFNNCTILGKFNVNAGGESAVGAILVENSRMANVNVNKRDTAVQIVVTGESCIKKMSVSEYAKIVQRNLSGEPFGTGIEDMDIQRAAYVSLTGNFAKVNLAGSKVDLSVSSGKIDQFNVNENCTLGTIVLDSTASIDKADVKAQCAFSGPGKIGTLYANASGITYETEPDKIIKGTDGTTTGGAITPSENEITIASAPANNASSIKTDSQITLTFSDAIKKADGTEITTSNIPSVIKLTKDSESGSDVAYTATINTAKTKITIIPDSDLSDDTRYYVTMKSGAVVDSTDKKSNTSFSLNFSTGEPTSSSSTVSFSPSNGQSGVSSTVKPVITFSQGVVRYSGGQVTTAYLASDAISLKKGTSSGSDVPFTAKISSDNKTITITPVSALTENNDYYIAINSNTLKTADGAAVASTRSKFTVGSASIDNLKPSVTDNSLGISFNSNANGTVYAIAEKNASSTLPTGANIVAGLNSANAKAISSDSVSVTAGGTAQIELSGLDTETKYTAYLVLRDNSGNLYSVFPVTATTDGMRLSSLKIIPINSSGKEGSNLLDSFSAAKSDYTAPLPSDTKSVKVTPDAGAFGGTITVRVNGVQLNYATNTAEVSKEDNTVIVTVTESGKTPKNYTISLKKVPEITSIYCNGTTDNITKDGSVYTLALQNSATSISIVVKMNYNGLNYASGIFELQTTSGKVIGSATAGNSIVLTPGDTDELKLIVYNSDKTVSDTYTLKLNRV